MEFNVFSEEVKKHLRRMAGDEYEIRESEVLKSNGLLLHGISLRKKGEAVAPTFYLEYLFRQFGEDDNARGAAESVMTVCREAAFPAADRLQEFCSYDAIKPLLTFQIMNEEMNRDLLREMPSEKFRNLAVTAYAEVPDFVQEEAIVRIRKEYLNRWGISEETLLRDAKENAPVLQPPVVIAMADIMGEILNKTPAFVSSKPSGDWLSDFRSMAKTAVKRAGEERERLADSAQVLVLTNQKRYMGAGVILYPNLLAVLGEEMGTDFYILPSSVHEVIIIGAENRDNADCLLRMVCEINHTELLREDFLADSLYYYSREEKEITLLR